LEQNSLLGYIKANYTSEQKIKDLCKELNNSIPGFDRINSIISNNRSAYDSTVPAV
jgi:hypothetical protein